MVYSSAPQSAVQTHVQRNHFERQAGNGFAFLELFRRTGDELWLDRARRFAIHAIEQSERMAAE